MKAMTKTAAFLFAGLLVLGACGTDNGSGGGTTTPARSGANSAAQSVCGEFQEIVSGLAAGTVKPEDALTRLRSLANRARHLGFGLGPTLVVFGNQLQTAIRTGSFSLKKVQQAAANVGRACTAATG
jgi:hypothetical protein